MSIPPGGTAVLNITVNATNGFSAPIAVTLTGLPTGVTSSPPSPFTMTTAGQTVTLTASLSATQGTVTLTLQATSGSLSSSALVTLQVAPLANFSVGKIDGPLTVRQGSSVSQAFTTTTGPGVTNFTLQFSVMGLPSGVTASITPNPAPPNTGMTLMINAAASAPAAQNALITVVAVRAANGMQASSSVDLNIANAPGNIPSNRTDFIRTDGFVSSAVYDADHKLIFSANPTWNRVDVVSPTTKQIVNLNPA